jgi:hypothetical protein
MTGLKPTTAHQRPCANCRHVGPLRKDWRWCCWNPIGCECTAGHASWMSIYAPHAAAVARAAAAEEESHA